LVSRSAILYALWCLFVVVLLAIATWNGSSPFADDDGGGGGHGIFVRGGGGPRHK
jgi:hypothetical protein